MNVMGFAAAANRTVPVAVMQLTWDFWTVFWVFWIVIVPVGLLVWMTVWVIRCYNRDLKKRETLVEVDETLEQNN